MLRKWVSFLLLILTFVVYECQSTTNNESTESSSAATTNSVTPVIGILSQPLSLSSSSSNSYVASSYVKWIEAGGGRSIAIKYDSTYEELVPIIDQLDGILFPGGNNNKLPESVKNIWKILQLQHDNNSMIPLWGTCLGMEYIIQLVAGYDIMEEGYNATNTSLPLLNVPSGSGSSIIFIIEIEIVRTDGDI